ncbi:MAG: hypothetical protein HGA22_08585, partial [Clostridiales bacterium]|nr:hypothetical protein [Clostridiales bacterium]
MPFSLGDINVISLVLFLLIALPVIAGAVEQLSGETVLRSAGSLLDTVELAAALLLSVYITNRVFFVQDGSVF